MPELNFDRNPPSVCLQVQARTGWVGMLRGVAAHVGTAAGLALDEVDDIRLAVDESYACLLAAAGPDSPIEVVFDFSPGVVRCTLTGTGGQPGGPVLGELSEVLLRSFVHELDAEPRHEGPRVQWVYRSAKELA